MLRLHHYAADERAGVVTTAAPRQLVERVSARRRARVALFADCA
jgi:hypothetical protein